MFQLSGVCVLLWCPGELLSWPAGCIGCRSRCSRYKRPSSVPAHRLGTCVEVLCVCEVKGRTVNVRTGKPFSLGSVAPAVQ